MTAPKGKARTNGNRAERRYKVPRGTVLLKFDDRDDLEVRTRKTSLGVVLDLDERAQELDGLDGKDRSVKTREFLDLFARRVLASWNLDDDVLDDDGEPTGEIAPVPPTLEGLLTLELEFVMDIFDAWMVAVSGVSGPLGQPSPGGPPSGMPEIPMETLSPEI